jgi:hypothetical protein
MVAAVPWRPDLSSWDDAQRSEIRKGLRVVYSLQAHSVFVTKGVSVRRMKQEFTAIATF